MAAPAERGSGQKAGKQEATTGAAEPSLCSRGEAGQESESRAEALTQVHRVAGPAMPRKPVPGKPRADRGLCLPGTQTALGAGEDAEPLPALSSACNARAAQACTLQSLRLMSASQIGQLMEGTQLLPRTPVTRECESWSLPSWSLPSQKWRGQEGFQREAGRRAELSGRET